MERGSVKAYMSLPWQRICPRWLAASRTGHAMNSLPLKMEKGKLMALYEYLQALLPYKKIVE